MNSREIYNELELRYNRLRFANPNDLDYVVKQKQLLDQWEKQEWVEKTNEN